VYTIYQSNYSGHDVDVDVICDVIAPATALQVRMCTETLAQRRPVD
jgi:hypothetical protein